MTTNPVAEPTNAEEIEQAIVATCWEDPAAVVYALYRSAQRMGHYVGDPDLWQYIRQAQEHRPPPRLVTDAAGDSIQIVAPPSGPLPSPLPRSGPPPPPKPPAPRPAARTGRR